MTQQADCNADDDATQTSKMMMMMMMMMMMTEKMEMKVITMVGPPPLTDGAWVSKSNDCDDDGGGHECGAQGGPDLSITLLIQGGVGQLQEPSKRPS